MNTFNLNNDEEFKRIIRNDNPKISPDPAISERLNYHFLLKSPMQKIYSNSFAGFFIWLLSFKNIALKIGIAAVLFSLFLFQNQITDNPSTILGDTTSNQIQLVDTNYIYKDTCRY
jgi:hypothetical protein